jgi:hypothetical protein
MKATASRAIVSTEWGTDPSDAPIPRLSTEVFRVLVYTPPSRDRTVAG